MHTHFFSGPTLISNGLNVLLFLTVWRLVWHHASSSRSPFVQSLATAALYQAG